MIRTPLCELLGIDHPVIQAGMGPYGSAGLAAAVSNAGGLGTVSTFTRPVEETRRQLALVQDLTSRSFAVNHVVQTLNAETFSLGLAAHPKLVSFALAHPGDFVRQAHDAGALVMLQVTTVRQAVEAAERGVDIVVAQGGEAGGYGGGVGTITLLPQVVDAVRPLPVVAAGGIFDGRGLAAALLLGAVGVNMGTRFLASAESPVSDGYKRVILGAASEDAIKVDVLNDVNPVGNAGFGTVLRAIRTPFIDEWQAKRDEARRDAVRLGQWIMEALRGENAHEVLPTAGQTSGGINEIRTAAEIIGSVVAEAEAALRSATHHLA